MQLFLVTVEIIINIPINSSLSLYTFLHNALICQPRSELYNLFPVMPVWDLCIRRMNMYALSLILQTEDGRYL